MVPLGALRLRITSNRLTTTTTNTINKIVTSLTSIPTYTLRTLSVRHELPTITRTTLLLTVRRCTFTRGQFAPRLLRQIPSRHLTPLAITTLRRLTIRRTPLLLRPLRQRPLTLRPLAPITTTSLAIRLRQQLRLTSRPLTRLPTLRPSHNPLLQTLTQIRLRVVHAFEMNTTSLKSLNRLLTPHRRPTIRLTPKLLNISPGWPHPIVYRNPITHNHIVPHHNTTNNHLYTQHTTATTTKETTASKPRKLFRAAQRAWGEVWRIFGVWCFWLDLSG
jgi:hypothetical protein